MEQPQSGHKCIYLFLLTHGVCAADQSVFLFICKFVCLTEFFCFPFIVGPHGNRVIKPALQYLPQSGQCCIFVSDANIDP